MVIGIGAHVQDVSGRHLADRVGNGVDHLCSTTLTKIGDTLHYLLHCKALQLLKLFGHQIATGTRVPIDKTGLDQYKTVHFIKWQPQHKSDLD
jgi:hypothetical protein